MDISNFQTTNADNSNENVQHSKSTTVEWIFENLPRLRHVTHLIHARVWAGGGEQGQEQAHLMLYAAAPVPHQVVEVEIPVVKILLRERRLNEEE